MERKYVWKTSEGKNLTRAEIKNIVKELRRIFEENDDFLEVRNSADNDEYNFSFSPLDAPSMFYEFFFESSHKIWAEFKKKNPGIDASRARLAPHNLRSDNTVISPDGVIKKNECLSNSERMNNILTKIMFMMKEKSHGKISYEVEII